MHDTSQLLLTHWGRDEMVAILPTTFSNALYWMKMNEFRLRFHWSLFPRIQLTIFQNCFHIMSLRRLGDKPLSEPMVVRLPTHICVIRLPWDLKNGFCYTQSTPHNNYGVLTQFNLLRCFIELSTCMKWISLTYVCFMLIQYPKNILFANCVHSAFNSTTWFSINHTNLLEIIWYPIYQNHTNSESE